MNNCRGRSGTTRKKVSGGSRIAPTNFEKIVLKIVLKIPLGQVRSYKWVAERIGRPRAYRAVANALRKNPYPLFIPCHRVVKSSKETGGYSLGLGLKKNLINLEKKIRDMIE